MERDDVRELGSHAAGNPSQPEPQEPDAGEASGAPRRVRPSLASKVSLLAAASGIAQENARAAGELGFSARLLAQTTLPHSDPGADVSSFQRTNGRVTLYVQGGPHAGLPYGSMPRLVLCWLVTEAVRTRSPRLVLGESLSAFMRELGIVPTGGRWGTITRLREQVRRLFAARLVAVEQLDGGERSATMEVASDYTIWWEPKRPDQAALWESIVVLSPRFFEEVIRRPVPVDLRALRALKRSPLGIDLYVWLCHRMSYLTEPSFVSFAALHEQFGADYADVKNFKKKVLREVAKIRVLWPELRARQEPGGLRLRPSPTHIERRLREGGRGG